MRRMPAAPFLQFRFRTTRCASLSRARSAVMQVSPMSRSPRELLGFKVLRTLQLPTAAALTITGTSTTPDVSLAIDPDDLGSGKGVRHLLRVRPFIGERRPPVGQIHRSTPA